MRVRLSKNGIEIAKPGYDVRTAAPANMVFTSLATAARVAFSGSVTCSSFSGFMDDRYYKGTVNFATAFPNPPIVLVAGAVSGGWSEHSPFQLNALPVSPGTGRILPWYSIETFTDHFDLYVLNYSAGGGPIGVNNLTWRYWVLANTVQS